MNASDLLTPAEVAQIFRVDPKTVTRWAIAGGKAARFPTRAAALDFLRAEVPSP